MSSITISDVIDSGNIAVVAVTSNDVRLKIKDEPFTVGEMKQHKMWFNFKVSGCLNQQTTFSIVNAGECSFPAAWSGYNVCTSYDRKEWFRTPTTYDEKNGSLVWSIKPICNQVYFSYFPPFSWERHCDLVAKCAAASAKNPFVPIEVKSVGKTLDGRDLDLIVIGDTSIEGHRKIWANARQHPGESQAEFWMEGYINRLLDDSDATTRALMKSCVFYIVPNMNPDGSIRGHLRTNASGANLNREWCDTLNSKSPAAVDGVYHAPTLERSPEVYHVLREMDRVGCDFFVDVHADEELPYNFVSGSEGCPAYGRSGSLLPQLQKDFCRLYEMFNKDFQSVKGYDIDAPNEANLSICSNQIGERFNCLSNTLEMPFKDTTGEDGNQVDPARGWTIERCQKLGQDMLPVILALVPTLR